jgi:hypothetical protein
MKNELVQFVDNKPIISEEFKEQYKMFINLKEQIEDAQSIIKGKMIEYFESLPEEDRKQLNFDTFKISYVKASTRKTFDSKKLQDEDIDTYNKYLKESNVKATIKFI